MGTDEDDGKGAQIVILDTIGELGRLYSLADVVFVGGSFVKVGAIIFWNRRPMENRCL